MLPASVRFVIIAQARSGSTLLRHALNAHPQITCHGEILSRAWINGLIPPAAQTSDDARLHKTARPVVLGLMPQRNDDPAGFVRQHVFDTAAKPVTGFKIIYEDLFDDSAYGHRIRGFLRAENPVVIHLTRLNPLAAYASRRRMTELRISHSDVTPDGTAEAPKLTLKRSEVTGFILRQAALRARVDDLFPLAHPLSYEHLRSQFPALLDRLGADPAPFTERLRKLGSSDLRDLIANYDELADLDAPRPARDQ